MDLGSEVNVLNSTLHSISQTCGNLSLVDSTCMAVLHVFTSRNVGTNWWPKRVANTYVSNCNVSSLWLFPYSLVGYKDILRVHPGFNENVTVRYPPRAANFTLLNSYVAGWRIQFNWFEGRISDSVVDSLFFAIDPSWSGNLTLTADHIDNFEMNFLSSSPTIENSTVENWDISVSGNNTITFVNSSDVSIALSHNSADLMCANISILGSTVTLLCTDTDYNGTLSTVCCTLDEVAVYAVQNSARAISKKGVADVKNMVQTVKSVMQIPICTMHRGVFRTIPFLFLMEMQSLLFSLAKTSGCSCRDRSKELRNLHRPALQTQAFLFQEPLS